MTKTLDETGMIGRGADQDFINLACDGLSKPPGDKELDTFIHYGAPRRILTDKERVYFQSWAATQYEITQVKGAGETLLQPSGAELFQRIINGPGYYINRAEKGILDAHKEEIVGELCTADCILELGPGDAEKTSMILEACGEHNIPYVGIEKSPSFAIHAEMLLKRRFPKIGVHIKQGDFTDMELLKSVGEIDAIRNAKKICVMALGTTLANFSEDDAVDLIKGVSRFLNTKDITLMLGLDSNQEAGVLQAAYGDLDRTGVFCLNSLGTLNYELGSNADLGGFDYRAIWCKEESSVEMTLVSKEDQSFDLCKRRIVFLKDEPIRMDRSRKWSREQVGALTQRAGFNIPGNTYARNGVNVMLFGKKCEPA
ncbi:MAG: L-histidine N(alpha)-methyltransferase [Anaerolineales bacterium]